MPRRYQTLESLFSALLSEMESEGIYSPKTIAHTREHCQIVARYLDGRNLYTLTPQEFRAIHQTMAREGLAVSTQKSYIFTLRKLLHFVNNPTCDTRIVYQADVRPKVDWLSPEEASNVLAANLPNIQKMAVVLALCMGLRKVEMCRLKMKDVNLPNRCITVTGKGRAGGKLRLVPFHALFLPTFECWLKDRAKIVSKSQNTAEHVLIWFDRHSHTANPYNSVKGSGLDKLIRSAAVTCGVHFSAHTLRRTFGRMLWLAGVPVVTIAKILGHSSTEQTLQYIGANLDDMASAMETLTF